MEKCAKKSVWVYVLTVQNTSDGVAPAMAPELATSDKWTQISVYQ